MYFIPHSYVCNVGNIRTWSVYAYWVDNTRRLRRMKRVLASQYSLCVQTNWMNCMFNVMKKQTLKVIQIVHSNNTAHKQQLNTEIRRLGCSHYLSYIIRQSTYTSNCRSKIHVEICVQMCMVSNSCVLWNIPVCKWSWCVLAWNDEHDAWIVFQRDCIEFISK
jgi:hypothetical protein